MARVLAALKADSVSLQEELAAIGDIVEAHTLIGMPPVTESVRAGRPISTAGRSTPPAAGPASTSAAAQDPRRRTLIAAVLSDFERLLAKA